MRKDLITNIQTSKQLTIYRNNFIPEEDIEIIIPQYQETQTSIVAKPNYTFLVALKIIITTILILFIGVMTLWFFEVFNKSVQNNLTACFVLMIIVSIIFRILR